MGVVAVDEAALALPLPPPPPAPPDGFGPPPPPAPPPAGEGHHGAADASTPPVAALAPAAEGDPQRDDWAGACPDEAPAPVVPLRAHSI